ncbi:MAG TPA: VanZ family protein [Candidatus Binatia bacterium]|nr:VanZ family protein [Candidatus Binatia bacterium]
MMAAVVNQIGETPKMIPSHKPKSFRNRILTWTPVLVWMAVIFLFSSEYFSAENTTPLITPILSNLFPDLAAPHIENIALMIRKLGHLGEYFILAFLLMRALNVEFVEHTANWRILWSLIVVVSYAASDEMHQAFVPSRTASLGDVIIDTLGGICGTLWFHVRNRDQKSS